MHTLPQGWATQGNTLGYIGSLIGVALLTVLYEYMGVVEGEQYTAIYGAAATDSKLDSLIYNNDLSAGSRKPQRLWSTSVLVTDLLYSLRMGLSLVIMLMSMR
jgi:hypothetical protein